MNSDGYGLIILKRMSHVLSWALWVRWNVLKSLGSILVSSITAKLFGKNLSRILEERGMSQLTLAEKLGINQGNVSQWVSGRSLPTGATIDVLCHILKVNTEEFFRAEGAPASIPQPNPEDAIALIAKALGFEPPKRLKKRDKK